MNLVLVVVVLVAAFKIKDGYKKGMVKQIISLVTLLVVGIMIALIGCALHTYMQKEVLGLIVAVLLLAVLGVIHYFLGFVFFSVKMISKLPVVSWLNKLLGALFGFLELVVFLQIVYFFIENFGLGVLGAQIQQYTAEVDLLQYIYNHNIVGAILEDFVASARAGIQ